MQPTSLAPLKPAQAREAKVDITLNGEIAVFIGVAGRRGPASRNIRARLRGSRP